MAHPNEDLVRRAYDAFSRGDVETLRQLFADDTIFHEPGRNPVSGDYQGIDQVPFRDARGAFWRNLPGHPA